MMKKFMDKLVEPEPAPPVEEESTDGKVSFCDPTNGEEIFNASETLTDYLNKLENTQ